MMIWRICCSILDERLNQRMPKVLMQITRTEVLKLERRSKRPFSVQRCFYMLGCCFAWLNCFYIFYVVHVSPFYFDYFLCVPTC